MVKRFDDFVSNKVNEELSPNQLDIYEVHCRDIDGELKKLLEYIAKNGNGGHSFSIVVDPDSDDEKKFYWDGDGGDYLQSVKIKQTRQKRKS